MATKMGPDMGTPAGKVSLRGTQGRESLSSRTHCVLIDIPLPFKSIRVRGKNINI